MQQNRYPKLIVIVGETATGKSELAQALAKKFNGEIINADSRQIYKGLDIGTAKASKAEQAEVPHHLLDIVSPGQPFSVAMYKKLADAQILSVATRGNLPIMIGGSGLYIDSVLFDFQFLPTNPALRKRLQNLTSTELLAQIYEQGIDMTGVDTKNKRRLVRLLETGSVRTEDRKNIRPNTLVLGLRIPRAELRKRIQDRIDTMLSAGLLDEVRTVGEEYGWDSEAMSGICYRAFKDVILGKKTVREGKADFLKGDLDLAKRQRTWFKRNRFIQWTENPVEAIDLVSAFVGRFV